MDAALHLSLALTAFLAGSILPFPSEAALAAAIFQQPDAMITLIAAASFGNILGAITNWYLGRWLEHYKDRRWFPVSSDSLERAQERFRRYGIWTLLLAWVPIIGDPLTVVAGVMRVHFVLFVCMVGAAKIGRYAIVAFALM